MRKTILLIEVPHHTEGAIPLLVCHHVQLALYASPLCGHSYLATKHPRKKGVQRKAFMLHTATLVLRLLRTHTGPLWNINIRWKILQPSTPRFLHYAWSPTAISIIEAVFKQSWGGILARNLWGNWLRSSSIPARLWCSHHAESTSTRLNFSDTRKMIGHDSCEHTSLPFYAKAEKHLRFRKGIFLKQYNTDKLVRLWKTQKRCHLLKEYEVFVLKYINTTC